MIAQRNTSGREAFSGQLAAKIVKIRENHTWKKHKKAEQKKRLYKVKHRGIVSQVKHCFKNGWLSGNAVESMVKITGVSS